MASEPHVVWFLNNWVWNIKVRSIPKPEVSWNEGVKIAVSNLFLKQNVISLI